MQWILVLVKFIMIQVVVFSDVIFWGKYFMGGGDVFVGVQFDDVVQVD